MTPRRGKKTGHGSGPPKLSLREPADVLAAIPYLVGFHPTDSVVVLALRGKRMVFCARADLPKTGAPSQEIREAVDHLARVMARQRADGGLVVGYGAADRADPVVTGLRAALERRQVQVLEVLRAAGGRYWSYLCEDPMCCPPEGSLYEPDASPVAAAATLAGMAVVSDRRAFEDQLKPVSGLGRVSMRQATERAHERLVALLSEPRDEENARCAVEAAGRTALAEALARTRDGGRLDDDEAAWLSVLVAAAPAGDVTWTQLFKGRADLGLHRSLWMDVFRRAEPDLAAAPGCLFAYAAWRSGNGALASVALERVLTVEPNHGLARDFADAIASGISPSVMDTDAHSPVRLLRGRPGRRRSSSRRAGSQRQ